jgi:hypothetical protein
MSDWKIQWSPWPTIIMLSALGLIIWFVWGAKWIIGAAVFVALAALVAFIAVVFACLCISLMGRSQR